MTLEEIRLNYKKCRTVGLDRGAKILREIKEVLKNYPFRTKAERKKLVHEWRQAQFVLFDRMFHRSGGTWN
jgi:hypothetical protein